MSGQRQAAGPDKRAGVRFGARTWRRSAGFTFAEVLAAMVFVGILIPVTVQGIMVANRAGLVADHKRAATQLADRLLNEMVVTDDWRTGDREGDFGEDWPGFRWTLEDETWDVDAMRVVTVEVTFDVQGNEYGVRLSTLVDEAENETTTE